MNLIKKDKKSNLFVIVGISLIALASTFWFFTIMTIRDQEIMLAIQDLGVRMSLYEEALQRLKNVYVTTVIPVTGILTILGLVAVISPLLRGFAQHFTLRKSRLTVVEEKAVSRWDFIREEPIVVLQKLISEEANLIEEKKELEFFREEWELKVKKDIETKQNSIRKLRAEIADLKFTKERLSKSTNVEVK